MGVRVVRQLVYHIEAKGIAGITVSVDGRTGSNIWIAQEAMSDTSIKAVVISPEMADEVCNCIRSCAEEIAMGRTVRKQ